jgi:hypothetical protein
VAYEAVKTIVKAIIFYPCFLANRMKIHTYTLFWLTVLMAEKVLRLQLISFPNTLEKFFQVIIKEEAVGISSFLGTLPSTPYGSIYL